jgi:hypothetical protein
MIGRWEHVGKVMLVLTLEGGWSHGPTPDKIAPRPDLGNIIGQGT